MEGEDRGERGRRNEGAGETEGEREKERTLNPGLGNRTTSTGDHHGNGPASWGEGTGAQLQESLCLATVPTVSEREPWGGGGQLLREVFLIRHHVLVTLDSGPGMTPICFPPLSSPRQS